MAKKNKDYEYRTYQFRITKNNLLFNYCDEMSFKSKNLYNIANFYIRQAFSGLQKQHAYRHENEAKVINDINNSIPKLNEIRVKTFEDRKDYKTSKKKKEAPNLFKELANDNSFISTDLLDSVFRHIEQVDYKSLPAQVNYHTLKLLTQDWKSFFEANKEYKINPSKFKCRPKTPKYAKKDGRKVAIFTNQACKVKTIDNKHCLIFPKTKLVLELGEIGSKINKLKEVKIIPKSNYYVIDIINEVSKSVVSEDSNRIIGIDLGVNNFATIANNIGLTPIIIKGGILKSKNQFYNKNRAYYYGILRQGMSQTEGLFTSKRLQNLDTKRHYFIKDFFHKASKRIITYCIENKIDTIIIGKNKGWKDNIIMRKDVKQSFAGIPYNLFISILFYKANEKGIKVIETEESYTSKASFLDEDFIPTYGVDDSTAKFSGRRISRGMYKTKDGTLINADCNGAYNIIRKVFPKAYASMQLRDNGVMNAPKSLSVA